MSPDVHLEGSHGLVLFAAVLAAEIVVLVSDDLEWLWLEYTVVVELLVLRAQFVLANWCQII